MVVPFCCWNLSSVVAVASVQWIEIRNETIDSLVSSVCTTNRSYRNCKSAVNYIFGVISMGIICPTVFGICILEHGGEFNDLR